MKNPQVQPKLSALFRHIERLQGPTPWGSVLDAGTGVNSSRWIASLGVTRWTAVSGSAAHAQQVLDDLGPRRRPQDRVVVGNWMSPELLAGERYDTVLGDYLLGAVEGFGPYFQQQLFARLRPLVGGRLYIVGLDPYVVGEATTPAEQAVRAIGRLRDVCLSLADETPYREFPLEWVLNSLAASRYRVLEAKRFANRYKARWIDSQLDMAARRLPAIADAALAKALSDRIESLRDEAHELCMRENGLRAGFDYIVACEPSAG